MEVRYVQIGKGHIVNARRVIAVLLPNSASSQRLADRASSMGKLFNCTFGKRTRSLVVMDDGSVLQSILNSVTLMNRLNGAYSQSIEDELDSTEQEYDLEDEGLEE